MLAKNGSGKSGVQELSDAELSRLDYALVIDHSGSMGSLSSRLRGQTLMHEVREDAIAIARIAEKYDSDGITVIPFSTGVRVHDGVTSSIVEKVFDEHTPRGGTNLTDALREVHNKAKRASKDMVAIVYTDGQPDNQDTVISAIKAMANELGRPKIGLAIIQVGNDVGAARFLDFLDNHLESAHTPDVVACLKAEDAEGLSFSQICWLARNA